MLNQNFKAIIDKAKSVESAISYRLKLLNKSLEERQSNIESLKIDLNDDLVIKQLFNETLKIKKSEMKVLESIVNNGLEYTYPDKELDFRIDFVEKNNRVVPEFFLNDLLLKPPFKGDGGGIISTIALLIYVAQIKLSNKRIVLMDEVESMVDLQASKRLFAFLKSFSEKYNITIILITHKSLDYSYQSITDKIKQLTMEEKCQ